MSEWIKGLFYRLFGYCDMCQRWFVYPKRRRMSTMYQNEESNYCTVCLECFIEIQEGWQDQWDDYHSSRF